MRIGLGINYAGGFKEVAAEVADLECAGLDIVLSLRRIRSTL